MTGDDIDFDDGQDEKLPFALLMLIFLSMIVLISGLLFLAISLFL